MRERKRYVEEYLYPALTIIGILVVWEVAVRLLKIPEYLLPAPSTIVAEGVVSWQYYAEHTYYTLYEVAVGFFMSVALGIPIAIAVVYSKFLQNTLYPIIVVLQSVPKVALAPLVMIWFFRVHELLPIFIITFLISFFPVIINTATGLMLVDPDLIDFARSLKASNRRIFWKVRLPSSLPSMFAGLKIAITLAVVGAVVGEFVGGNKGLGYVILFASSQLLTKSVFVCLALLSVMGIVLFEAVAILEKVVVPWAYYEETR